VVQGCLEPSVAVEGAGPWQRCGNTDRAGGGRRRPRERWRRRQPGGPGPASGFTNRDDHSPRNSDDRSHANAFPNSDRDRQPSPAGCVREDTNVTAKGNPHTDTKAGAGATSAPSSGRRLRRRPRRRGRYRLMQQQFR